MSYIFSRALVEEYSQDTSSDGAQSAPLNMNTMPLLHSSSAKMMEFCSRSRSGMTFAIDISVHQRKMCTWTKNTGTEMRENALFAAKNLPRATRVARSNVARMPAVEFFKQEKRFVPALSAARNSCHPGRDTRRVLVRAEPLLGCRAGSLIRWSMCETSLQCFAAQLLQGVCGTRQTERRRFLVTRSRNCARTLKPISRKECHGTTTGRDSTNGA